MQQNTLVRLFGFSLLLFFISAPLSLYAAAEDTVERHALVIGNSEYSSNLLLNPRNDATDMAKQLSAMGYRVHKGGPLFDLDRLGMERAVIEFSRTLPKNASALFYYAGHGMATRFDNYLIPINHQLQFQEQLPDRSVSLRSVVEIMKNANPEGINVLLLDACRDNPLVRSFRSSKTGLQRLVNIPRGIFIGYAADSGQVAEDGTGRNGTYTGELLNVMAENPHTIVEIAHKEVAKKVYEKTNGAQFPVSENKVYGNWCFGACKPALIEKSAEEITTQASTEPTSAKPTLEIKPKSKTWKIVGGVVLGLVAVGLAADCCGSSGSTPSNSGTFEIIATPPE